MAESHNQARHIASDILTGAADTASKLARSLPAEAKGAVLVGAGVVRLVAELVCTLGVDQSKAVLEELKRRVDTRDGVISDADLAADDARAERMVRGLFRDLSA